MLVLSRRIKETIVLPSCGVTFQVLAISKSSVKLGVTAPLEIPVHRGEIVSRISLASEPQPTHSGVPIARLLIADPEPLRLETYRRFLARKGFGVRTATTGVECVCRLRDGTPDALVLHSRLLWGGAVGVLALMSDPSSGVPSVPVVIQGNGPVCSDLNGKTPRKVDLAGRLLEPSELVERIRKLLNGASAASDSSTATSFPTDADARLADWIKRRTGGRIDALRVERQAGRVIVHGCARSYYVRQLAQHAARELLDESWLDRSDEVVVDITVS
jgi:carbon storage regulator